MNRYLFKKEKKKECYMIVIISLGIYYNLALPKKAYKTN